MDAFAIYCPIAGLHINALLLLFIGFTVGVSGGFFGVGGAWIVTPALNLFGFPMPYAIGTDLAHMGGKSIVPTIRHARFGNVDVRLGLCMMLGTTVGMEIGARIVMALERRGVIERISRMGYVVFLAGIGTLLLFDYVQNLRRTRGSLPPATREPIARRLQRLRLPPRVRFRVSGVECSLWLPVLVGLATGFIASLLGVGGGFIRMPALIYLIGCPTAVAVGTDLLEVAITGTYGGFTYALKGRVDLIAALWMLGGAAVGAQLGTVAVKYVRGYFIRLLLAITVFIACAAVLLKHFDLVLASQVTIVTAATVISAVILWSLATGVARSRAQTGARPRHDPAT